MSNRSQPIEIATCLGNTYANPWDPWPHSGKGILGRLRGVWTFLKWYGSLKLKSFMKVNYDEDMPVYRPDLRGSNSNLKATWLGHASVYVEIDGFKILFDPVFGNKVPPFVGPSRYRPCPCNVEDLPEDLDAVVISHNHYDHMDTPTLKKIYKKFPELLWLVPIGDRHNVNFECCCYVRRIWKYECLDHVNQNIKELSWWEEEIITKNGKNLKLVFTPSQHWSNRGATDVFKSLWGSWTLIGPKHKFWFGGDTGYCPAFKEIGEEHGPFDMAAIPIGAYEPRELMKFQHVSPKESVLIHQDIKSKFSFGIHWGTFILTNEEKLAPRNDLKNEVDHANSGEPNNNLPAELETFDNGREYTGSLKKVVFETLHHGESVELFDDENLKYRTSHGERKEETNRGCFNIRIIAGILFVAFIIYSINKRFGLDFSYFLSDKIKQCEFKYLQYLNIHNLNNIRPF